MNQSEKRRRIPGRRWMIKTLFATAGAGLALTNPLGRRVLASQLEGGEGGDAQALAESSPHFVDLEQGVEWRLDESPHGEMVRFALFIASVVNRFDGGSQDRVAAGQALAEQLATVALPQVKSADGLRRLQVACDLAATQYDYPGWKDVHDVGRVVPLNCVGFQLLLGVQRGDMWGAPYSMEGIQGDALTLASQLLGLRTGESAECGGVAVRFDGEWARLADLMPGDTIACRYDYMGASKTGHVAVVLDAARRVDDGERTILVTQSKSLCGS